MDSNYKSCGIFHIYLLHIGLQTQQLLKLYRRLDDDDGGGEGIATIWKRQRGRFQVPVKCGFNLRVTGFLAPI
jgi:hypothetical protein